MYIVTAQEMYDIERHAIGEVGIPSVVLMETAGRSIASEIVPQLKGPEQIMVAIGAGNNGGDGWVIARVLLEKGYQAIAVQTVPDAKIKGDALLNKQIFEKVGGHVEYATTQGDFKAKMRKADIIIDAILGIGTRGDVREPYKGFINSINESCATVISVDIPSGIEASEGATGKDAVQADQTYMLGAAKLSAFLPKTAPYFGEWQLLDIGLPRISFESRVNRKLTTIADVRKTLQKRNPFAHKGTYGKGLIVGGSEFMPGSVTMTVMAALRTGAGLCTVATEKAAIPSIAANCLEAMYKDRAGIPEMDLSDFDGIAMGPGMGQDKTAGELVNNLFRGAECPLVIDADALQHAKEMLHAGVRKGRATLLTPHPGEMARLLDIEIGELLANPFSYSARFAEQTGSYVLLKGKHTIVTAPDGRQSVNNTGNAGLAKGGTGDVLTGIVLALAMQQDDPFEALRCACHIHGLSADIQVESAHSEHDLLATDVVKGIGAVYRKLL
ncbi:NAD(P)H-hydrate dehydratase [Aciduricibacillus chroicocephali]|uniref:Bifunctional NAD(P)H-hydrate repair enzyme n=1 Tax=Aciduricibacillus chroicocephali TaxID=3054939 RepID=A0ABY9KWJ0_9BACI|nr:NAD(P)H-hydrate dehydratase [Bacillaceae bacterium 44XB]